MHLIPLLEALEGYLREPFDRLMHIIYQVFYRGEKQKLETCFGWKSVMSQHGCSHKLTAMIYEKKLHIMPSCRVF